MKTYNWNDVPVEQMNPLITRQVIHGASITLARIGLAKGALVPAHSHPNEQISTVEAGLLRFIVSGVTMLLKPGQSVVISSNQPHSVEALEDSVAVDVFAPVREDWIRGDDAYLRRT